MRWPTVFATLVVVSLIGLSPGRAANDDAVAFGNFHALVIGNNDYQHLSKLKSAATDAQATAALLAERYGFKVKLLLNATRDQTLAELNRLRAELGPEDNLLIYYAGHGTIDRQTNTGFWLPVDAAEDDDLKWIATDDLSRRVKAMAARHVLVVADSCYSGALVRDANVQPKTGGERAEWLKRMTQKRARTAMVSGGLEPVTDQGAGGHSVFANAFFGALTENDEPLEGAVLFQRLRQKVVLNAEQTPQYADIRLADHEGGDFIFVPKGAVVVAAATPAAAGAPQTRGPSRPAAAAAPVPRPPLPGDVGATFRDCTECPEMVVAPAGKFTMGGPKRPNQNLTFEAPEREVTIEKRFAIGRHEVTRSEYAAFVTATKRPVPGG